jgi:hypothetical protein
VIVEAIRGEAHEPESRLAPESMEQAVANLLETFEAIDWYEQRIRIAADPQRREILRRNRDRIRTHAVVVLEWIRCQDDIAPPAPPMCPAARDRRDREAGSHSRRRPSVTLSSSGQPDVIGLEPFAPTQANSTNRYRSCWHSGCSCSGKTLSHPRRRGVRRCVACSA